MYNDAPTVASSTTTAPVTHSKGTTYAAQPENAPNSTFNVDDSQFKGYMDSNFLSVPLLSTPTKWNIARLGMKQAFNFNENGDGTNLTECASNPEGIQLATKKQIETMISLKQTDMSLRGWKDALNQQGLRAMIMPRKNPFPWEDKLQLVVFDQHGKDITEMVNQSIAQAQAQAQEQVPTESVA